MPDITRYSTPAWGDGDLIVAYLQKRAASPVLTALPPAPPLADEYGQYTSYPPPLPRPMARPAPLMERPLEGAHLTIQKQNFMPLPPPIESRLPEGTVAYRRAEFRPLPPMPRPAPPPAEYLGEEYINRRVQPRQHVPPPRLRPPDRAYSQEDLALMAAGRSR